VNIVLLRLKFAVAKPLNSSYSWQASMMIHTQRAVITGLVLSPGINDNLS
jgi:hypothetical protein